MFVIVCRMYIVDHAPQFPQSHLTIHQSYLIWIDIYIESVLHSDHTPAFAVKTLWLLPALDIITGTWVEEKDRQELLSKCHINDQIVEQYCLNTQVNL